MKAGDYIPGLGLTLIRELGFKEMCKMYDDNYLDYDLDDLWAAYEKRGTPWRVMLTSGKASILWPHEAEGYEIVSANACK